MHYFNELKRTMEYLGSKPDVLFVGQAVAYPGTAMRNTLVNIDSTKLIELPVAEEMQLGASIGLAMSGYVPISIYPRWNFLLLAFNQLINHLDKLSEIAKGGYSAKVIIRTAIGSEYPLNPQHQHVGDFTDGVRAMCKNISVVRLERPEEIFRTYEEAYEREDNVPSLIVEHGDYLNKK
jgi:pyruvate/2-oxoglutarate/acetoin dehydrogenase E1 component